MIGRLQLLINGKINTERPVTSWKESEALAKNFKGALLPTLSDGDTWEIVLLIKSNV